MKGFYREIDGAVALFGFFLAAMFSASPAQAAFNEFKLTAFDGAILDQFGVSVAVSGDTALVGAFADSDAGNATGSAYLFDATTGQFLDKLTASDAAAGDDFGYSVAASGDTAIIGAPREDLPGLDSGSAYLFNATNGQELYKLTASDAAPGDIFGWSVAIDDGLAVVGAPLDNNITGAAYLFDATNGQQLFKLTADDAAAGTAFGYSVSVSGNTALVGSVSDDDAGLESGSAYLFDATNGQQIYKLTASDASAGDRFGRSVAISGNVAIVGAYVDDGRGSAYLFDVTTGQELFKLDASDAAAGDNFGWTVAISGNLALVGAHRNDDAGTSSGSAYLFDVTTGLELAKFNASDAVGNDQYGYSVAIDGHTVLIGALGVETLTGAAYLYTIPEPSTLVLLSIVLAAAWKRN